MIPGKGRTSTMPTYGRHPVTTNDSGGHRRERGWTNPDFPPEELLELARRVGAVAQRVRERAGLTQTDVGQMGGPNQRTLSSWETATSGTASSLALLDLKNLLPLERFYSRFHEMPMGTILMEAGIIPSKPEGVAALASLPGLNAEGIQHMLDLYALCLKRFPEDHTEN